MAKQTVNIGSSANDRTGDNLRTAFNKLNTNFDEIYLSVDSLTSQVAAIQSSGSTNSASGNTIVGDIQGSVIAEDSTVLVDGVGGAIDASNLTGALPAIDGSALTGVASAFSDLTGTPTTIAGYGITDAYTKAEVDSAITSSVLPAGSTQSIDIVAQDSTVLVDSVNGTLNATTLTGALPAIDGSALTGITTSFSNITSTPTTIAGYGITDAYTKAEVDSSIASVTAGHFDFNITGDDSTVRTVTSGSTLQITGGTAITTASDVDGNITITGVAQDFAFSSLTGTPTTISGYGITDALTAGGALTGSSLEAVAVGSGVADGNDLTITGGDATELNSTGGDTNITGGSGALASGNVNIGATQTTLVTIGSGSNNVDFPNGTAVDFTGTTVTGLPAAYSDSDVDAHLNQGTAGSNEVLSWTGSDYAWVAQSGGGASSRSTKTGTTTSLADAAEADLDITGFKSYALLAITTDRAARVRLYVSAATRTADASRAEGTDPTSDAGLIAEVITTGADTVIISPGAYGFNLESTPTTTIPCRVTNKSGGTSTVQVDLNILQLEA